MVMLIIASKVIVLIILCICVTVTDIKNGIIGNKPIFTALCIGVFLNLMGFITDSSHMAVQMINVLLAVLLSVLLYCAKIWAAGDCKLLCVIAVLVPYELYLNIFNKYMALVIWTAIIFAVSYVYLIIESVVMAIKRKHVIGKNKFMNLFLSFWGKWISCIVYITLIDSVLPMIFPYEAEYNAVVLIVNVALIMLISGIPALKSKHVIAIAFLIEVLLRLITVQPIFTKLLILNGFITLAFVAMRFLIDEYNYDVVKTQNIKKGMILSAATTLQFINSKVHGLPGQSTEDLRSRLTDSEAIAVRKWENSKYGTHTVQIVRKMPFAIFIFIGTIVFMSLGAIFNDY